MSDKVNFDEASIKEYLDNCIRKWRDVRNDPSDDLNNVAIYYCDAFQSVRVSLFGELLPKED